MKKNQSRIVPFEFPGFIELGWSGNTWAMPQEALIVDSKGHTIGQVSLVGLKTGEPLYLQAVPEEVQP